jgi:hypothetical protein
LNHHSHPCGTNLDALDIVIQLERLVDFRIRIERQKESLQQKIEQPTRRDRDADLHARQKHGALSAAGLHAILTFTCRSPSISFGEQPAGLLALRVSQLQKIDQRETGGGVRSQLDALLADARRGSTPEGDYEPKR